MSGSNPFENTTLDPEYRAIHSVVSRISKGGPTSHLTAQIRFLLQDIWAANWFYEERRGRSEVVKELRLLVQNKNQENRITLTALLKSAPYSTLFCSIKNLSNSTDVFDQAAWLIQNWSKGNKASAGRGKAILKTEPHPKVLCVVLLFAILEHVHRYADFTDEEKSELARQLFQAAVGRRRIDWAGHPYNSWRPHFKKARQLIADQGPLYSLAVIWRRQLEQAAQNEKPTFSMFELN